MIIKSAQYAKRLVRRNYLVRPVASLVPTTTEDVVLSNEALSKGFDRLCEFADNKTTEGKK